jgi:outer membrane protein assembly factor BamA
LRNIATKITLIIVSCLVLYSCSITKRVPDGKHLLMDTDVTVDGETKNDEELKDQLYQLPNTNILGYRLRLHLYNMAKKDADSSYLAWLEKNPGWHKTLTATLSEKQVQRLGNSFIVSGFSNFLKKTGEPPVIVDEKRVKRSKARLNAYFYKKGFFDNKVSYKIDTTGNKKAVVHYDVVKGKPYIIDSIFTYIDSPPLDSLYQQTKNSSLIKSNTQYDEANFTGERERLYSYFRNRGAYRFERNNISYVVDTVGTNHRPNVEIIIDDETVRTQDSIYKRPFKLYKISRVDIYTSNPNSADQSIDSTTYKGFNIYSTGKLNYRPKALTDPIFMTPGSTYADFRRVLTSRYLNNLNVFVFPKIEFEEDITDSTGTSLIAKIKLRPRKKFIFNVSADFLHSNIQDFGVQGSLGLSIRNIFRGAEILQISTRGNIGSSRDLAIQDNSFFNVSEYGADVKLTFPRIFFPINTERIIPKEMIPSTQMSFGISRQKNIGLDKENFTGVLSYNWAPPRRNVTFKYDLFNIQYIKNINAENYFNVYRSSYDRLNTIAKTFTSGPDYFDESGNLIVESGTNKFIADVENNDIVLPEDARDAVNSIEERRERLTENNLIFSSNFTYTTSTRSNLIDETFFIFKTKVETAGNTLSLLSGLIADEEVSESGNKKVFGIEYSQYVKAELDMIKHWDLRRGKVFAMRAFFGIAIPYGNSNSIPFTRSYFAGGSNDNRAWQSYSLGPGTSGGVNDFNEANFKMAGSAEMRFNIFGQLNGAVFADAGNIWNVFDDEDTPSYKFNGLESFRDIALGTGFGLRYDFNFFVVRFDIGFKTYNPGRAVNDRWFREYNFANSVFNVGINYPF